MEYKRVSQEMEIVQEISLADEIQFTVEEEYPEMEKTFNLPKKLADYLIPGKLEEAVKKKGGRLALHVGDNNSDRFSEFLFVDEGGTDHGSFVFDESREHGGAFPKLGDASPVLYVQFSRLNQMPEVLVMNTIDLAAGLQGQGIGGEFEERLTAMASALQFEVLVSDAENEQALRFYLAHGFEILEEGDPELDAMIRQGIFDGEEGHTPVIKRYE